MAKIHPKGIVPHALGPTYTENSTIKFQNGGGHKMKPAKPDEQGMGNSSGTIPNKTLIPTMKGNMTPKEAVSCPLAKQIAGGCQLPANLPKH